MEKEAGLPGVHQHNPDCDIWAHEYFAPSWFCLPNNQSALTVVRPGDTARDTLELICKVGAAGACGLEESGGSGASWVGTVVPGAGRGPWRVTQLRAPWGQRAVRRALHPGEARALRPARVSGL